MRRLALTLALCLVAAPAWAQVAFDAGSEAEVFSTSLSWSHTTSGANRVLYVTLFSDGSDIVGASCTYNSVSMDTFFNDTTYASREIFVFRLLAPATGSNTIACSWTGSMAMAGMGASFTGADQGDPDDTHVVVDGSAGGTSWSQSVSSATGDMVMDVTVNSTFVTVLAAGGGQTEIHQRMGGGSGHNSAGTSYEAGAASVTMGWSWTGFSGYMGFAWNINQAATATCTGGVLLMGAGKC